MTLFNRDFAVTIGTKRIAARQEGDKEEVKPTLRVAFKVEKSTNRDPNKATVAIWNLSPDSRATLQSEERIPVTIEAGYVDEIGQLFVGDLEFAASERQGPDWVTEFESGDGSRQYRSARINESLAAGTLLQDVLKKSSEALGLGLGNALEKIQSGDFKGGLQEFTTGVTLNGKASDILDKYMTAAGFEWSIQDGQLQVLRPNETTPELVPQLTFSTGLIGSPELGDAGKVRARSLLRSRLAPGSKVEIISTEVDGFFKIEKVVHAGDSWGNDWYSDLEAIPL